MESEMANVELLRPILTALPTLLAVILGGVVTYLSTSKMKRMEFAQARLIEGLKEKRLLYANFLKVTNEVTSSYYLDKNADHSAKLPSLVIELTRIQLLGGNSVYESAREIVSHITDLILKDSEPSTKLHELTQEFIDLAKVDLA